MKYIDLLDEIADAIHWDATVADTLKWLDDHPDATPGGTILASTVESETKDMSDEYIAGYADALDTAKVQVVDDPEPTDEDRMISDLGALAEWGLHLRDWHKGKIAQKLTELGWTKGGDES